jgi:hypothetical protein
MPCLIQHFTGRKPSLPYWNSPVQESAGETSAQSQETGGYGKKGESGDREFHIT